jgi:hypothetical protein
MPFSWLCYRQNNHISVVIEPGAYQIRACTKQTWLSVQRDLPITTILV